MMPGYFMSSGLLLLTLVLCTQCTSTEERKQKRVETVEKAKPAALYEIDCSRKNACSDNGQSRTFCRATLDDKSYSVWAESACKAAAKLQDKLCTANVDPVAIQSIDCQPDSSAGECPKVARRAYCNQADAKTNVRCIARRYDDRILANGQQFVGQGVSDCHARQALLWTTCENGLQPSLLSEISCETEQPLKNTNLQSTN